MQLLAGVSKKRRKLLLKSLLKFNFIFPFVVIFLLKNINKTRKLLTN